MTTRFHVMNKFHLSGPKTVVTGLMSGEEPVIRTGDHFIDESSGSRVTILGVNPHTKETPDGTEYALSLDKAGAEVVQPGSILRKEG